MFTDHDHFIMLVQYFQQFGDDAEPWLFMVFQFFYSDGHLDGIADKNGFGKADAVVAIGHRHFVDEIGGEADSNGENERAMRDPFFEWLCLTPFFIHMVRKEVARLAGMDHYIRFRNGTALRIALSIKLKIFVKFFYLHNYRAMIAVREKCAGRS
jgi:hypothetical protein